MPFKAQTPFRPCNHGTDAEGTCSGAGCGRDASGVAPTGIAACSDTPVTEFDEFNGGIHNGIDDHSVAIGMAWQPVRCRPVRSNVLNRPS